MTWYRLLRLAGRWSASSSSGLEEVSLPKDLPAVALPLFRAGESGERRYRIRIFSYIPKGGTYQREGGIKVKVKDLKPKRIKDYLECKISQRNQNQLRKSAQAGPVVSCRDIPFVIQLKQIIEAPR
ncbi:hypothetical protein GQ457_16G018930 [Hibiscus cannabinus]